MLFETILSIFLIPRDIIYWVKWIISYVLIRLYKASHRRRFDLYDPYAVNDPVKLNYLVPDIEKELESPLPESHLQHADERSRDRTGISLDAHWSILEATPSVATQMCTYEICNRDVWSL
ncbi:uncharacterized protein LOC118205392 [Stegodyphus dumicola]|uniref:uncharacterized protein LOC118205392 n=1 Tax=Stegodyphus dumicola TaxID=202533 RepID=UPI0015B21CDF|nr:uncharacterized protein LOC118205392 [Stegodyphus dumicola]